MYTNELKKKFAFFCKNKKHSIHIIFCSRNLFTNILGKFTLIFSLFTFALETRNELINFINLKLLSQIIQSLIKIHSSNVYNLQNNYSISYNIHHQYQFDLRSSSFPITKKNHNHCHQQRINSINKFKFALKYDVYQYIHECVSRVKD